VTYDLANPNPKPGDGLRDEVAALLAARHDRVQTEHRESGKKSDIYFERMDYGAVVRVYVECKDYAVHLTRSDLVTIVVDYRGIMNKYRRSQLLIVSKNGVSSDGQLFIDEQDNIRHQTIWELENDTLGLTNYIRGLRELFFDNGLSQYYIEARGSSVKYSNTEERTVTERSDLLMFEAIREWIDNSTNTPIAILGGYGAGKSSFAKRVVSHQAAIALENPKARRPVLIPLGNLTRFSTIEGLLGGMFTYDFVVPNFNVRHFLKMNEAGRLLIILDGFDEMKHAMTWADFRSQISDLNRFTRGNSKVILLGRPSAFISLEEHVYVLRGKSVYGDSFRKLPDWPEFSEIELSSFDPQERYNFIRKYLIYLANHDDPQQLEPNRIENRASEVNAVADNDPDVFSKPVHSKILTDLASDMNVDLSVFKSGTTKWTLYDTFFASLLDRELEKEARRPIGGGDRLAFSMELAYWLWSEKGSVTSFDAMDVPPRIFDSFPGSESDSSTQRREFYSGSFLEKKYGDVYYFRHRSFAEFLVAKRMLTRVPSKIEHGHYSNIARDGVLLFLVESPIRKEAQHWAETLDTVVGRITVNYIRYIAESFESIEKFLDTVPSKSLIKPIYKPLLRKTPVQPIPLQSTDEKGLGANWTRLLSWIDPNAKKILLGVMRSHDNDIFYLALGFLLSIMAQSPLKQKEVDEFAVELSSIILGRVFTNAQ
jgi:hypothetical protein